MRGESAQTPGAAMHGYHTTPDLCTETVQRAPPVAERVQGLQQEALKEAAGSQVRSDPAVSAGMLEYYQVPSSSSA